jgi:hypothetical protein
MTRRTNARTAGVAFLIYIAVTIASIVLLSGATSGADVAAQLTSISQHATGVRLTIVLGLLGNFCALVLGVTLYAITREQDADLAMLALACRLAEGISGMDVSKTLGLLWLATAPDAKTLEPGAASALSAFLLQMEAAFTTSAALFAVGSTLFSWLLLRGRLIPVPLAWFGVLSSILPVVCFPLQLVGLLGGPMASFMWYPVLLFELMLAPWLIVKGVVAPAPKQPA